MKFSPDNEWKVPYTWYMRSDVEFALVSIQFEVYLFSFIHASVYIIMIPSVF